MIDRTLKIDGEPAVLLEKDNEPEYFETHAIPKSVAFVSDLETETVALYECPDNDADNESYRQHE